MIYYLSWPLLSILLIVLQNTVADIIFSGRLFLEISIIIVVYAGFRFNMIKGAITAFILGFVFDCIAGSILGLFALIYVLVFLLSFFVSARLVTERAYFIAFFTLICAFLEEFAVILFYYLVYGFSMFRNTQVIFFLQPLIVGLLAPVFFYMMRRVEVFFYGKPAQSAERTGTCRIPAET
jgi:rod shape-determining protein MreD